MIDNLTINYTQDKGIKVSLSNNENIDTCTPANMAKLFAKVIKDSNVNAYMVIENLRIEFNYDAENTDIESTKCNI